MRRLLPRRAKPTPWIPDLAGVRSVQDTARGSTDDGRMPVDLSAAADFLAAHARLLDQQRFRHLCGAGDAEAALTALAAYRNPDGGYGWGLEPDLRSPESQPGPALHAF